MSTATLERTQETREWRIERLRHERAAVMRRMCDWIEEHDAWVDVAAVDNDCLGARIKFTDLPAMRRYLAGEKAICVKHGSDCFTYKVEIQGQGFRCEAFESVPRPANESYGVQL